MKDNQTKKYYWGIGLENETYMQFEESLTVSGEFIQEKIGYFNFLKSLFLFPKMNLIELELETRNPNGLSIFLKVFRLLLKI